MPFKVIIDFDGTLTAEEDQVGELAESSLRTLADDILAVPLGPLVDDYFATQREMLMDPHLYGWWVNGLLASYCDEGPFILHTSTLMLMLDDSDEYSRAVAAAYPHAESDPVAACTNHLFHLHTARIKPVFRPAARAVLDRIKSNRLLDPMILTNSMGDKVTRQLRSIGFRRKIPILGDTRQYQMDPEWPVRVLNEEHGCIQEWPVDDMHVVDLRRPAYWNALGMTMGESEGEHVFVVGDTFSLPRALALSLRQHFLLLHNSYTPEWCLRAVRAHPYGRVLDDLADLPAALDDLARAERGAPSNR